MLSGMWNRLPCSVCLGRLMLNNVRPGRCSPPEYRALGGVPVCWHGSLSVRSTAPGRSTSLLAWPGFNLLSARAVLGLCFLLSLRFRWSLFHYGQRFPGAIGVMCFFFAGGEQVAGPRIISRCNVRPRPPAKKNT